MQEKAIEQAGQLFASADIDADRRLSYAELTRLLKNVRAVRS